MIRIKRSNGSGCIRKLSGNRRKPYQAVITSKYIEGKQIFKSIGTYETKEKAEYELYRFVHNIKSNMTLAALYKEWSGTHYKKLSKNSIIYYTNAYNKMKMLHQVDISELKLSDLQKHIIPLTKPNQKAFKITISQMLDYAVANDYIEKNYAKYLEITSIDNKKVKKVFTKDEIGIYANTDNIYNIAVSIMLYTGIRVGELLNLKIKDCNLESKTICIQKGKTKNAKRNIPVHHKIENIVSFLCNSNNIYLIEKNGLKIEYGAFRREFIKRYNHTSHETRHTFATRCKLCNVDTLATKLILGHSVQDITYGTYTHVTIDFLRQEIEKIYY